MEKQKGIKFGIGRKLLVYFLILSLVPIIIGGSISFTITKNQLEESTKAYLSNLVRDCGRKISYYVSSRYQDIKLLSQADVFEGNDTKAKQKYIDEVIEAYPFYDAITIIDLNKTIIACTRKECIGQSRADHEWFKKTIQCKKGDVIPLDAYRAETAGWKIVIGFNTPITDETNKEVIGVLTTRVRMDHIIDRVQALYKRIMSDNHAYLLNKRGEILAGPDEKQFLNIHRLHEFPVVKDLLDGKTGITEYENDRGEDVISARYALKGDGDFNGWGWGIILTESVSEAFKAAYIIRNTMITLVLVIAFLVIIFAVFISKRFSRPIKEVSQAALRISQEDLKPIKIEYHPKDEMGDLVGAFNKMAENLHATINEIKHAEEDLWTSKEYARNVIDSSLDMIITVNTDRYIVEFNKAAEETFGYRRDEVVGTLVDILYANPQEGLAVHKETVEQGQCVQEILNRRKNGKVFPSFLSASLLRDAQGEVVGVMGVSRDITEAKKTEEALHEREERFRDISYSMADWIWEVDNNGRYTFASGKVKEILGYDPEELIGKTPFELMPEDEQKRIGEVFKRITSEKKPIVDLENWNLTKEGNKVCLLTNGVPLLNESGELVGYRGVDKNITEHKRAEEEKKKLEAQLRHAQRMESIGTLAGGIAHNFNNLLMGIMGNASLMLLETDSAHPNYARLKNIEKSVQSGARLTHQLLGYAREGKYEIKPISLNQLVEETSNTFGTTKKEIRVHRELAENLFGIKADQGQIEQVLLNLYVNAAEAMPDGGDLFLKTMNVTDKDMKSKPYEPKPGNYVFLTVGDTGVGMDKKTMKRIFDPFFTTKGLAKSTGLGLASVYGIVKAHGGYIDVYSEKGEGASFEIYLPATSAKRKELSAEGKEQDKMVRGKETVLLVDDEEMIIDVGQEMLKTLGYKVLVARGGKEAIDIYKKNEDNIDLVLLDIIMPDMGGGQTYDRLREINPDIKVLLSSGYSIDDKAKEILERGCDGFVQKPFDIKALSQNIREILDKR